MQLAAVDESTIEATVTIECPVESVYEFYRDFRNLPHFLGDVMQVELTGPGTTQGPLGIQAHWTIKVIEDRRNELIRYETVETPRLRSSWEVFFSPGIQAGQTEVRKIVKSPLGRLGWAALAIIGKFPAQEVTANLNRLKQLMETGKVTDTSYAVAGKFDEPSN
jgi:uncharacterized membrane protein